MSDPADAISSVDSGEAGIPDVRSVVATSGTIPPADSGEEGIPDGRSVVATSRAILPADSGQEGILDVRSVVATPGTIPPADSTPGEISGGGGGVSDMPDPISRPSTSRREAAGDRAPASDFLTTFSQYNFEERKGWVRSFGDADVRRALAAAGRARAATVGLDLDDLGALLSPAAAPHLEEMAQISHRLTVERFGRTMQLYAPLYLSNVCGNVCTYCGFSAQNRIPRKVLNDSEIVAEGEALRKLGFEHVLLVTGEAGRVGRTYLANALRLLRPYFSSLSIEVQPLPEADYAALRDEGLSSVLVYQETYDAAAYGRHHLAGPKADMPFRLETPDRLGRAGMKKIGLGALFGLSDWRTDAWFTGLHLRDLERRHWRTRYSISFPRLRPHVESAGGGAALLDPTRFGERELVQTLCAFRLFSPEAELSLSTRESAAFRDRAFKLGFTSMSAGSRTNPGGYGTDPDTLEQFEIDDDRTPAEVAAMLRGGGYEPVWKDWDATYDGKRTLSA